MLLAEDLLLLLLDDRTGRPRVPGSRLDLALGGAVLAELEGLGLIDTARLGPFGGSRVRVVSMAAHADEILVDALRALRERPKSPTSAVRRISRGLRPTLLARLAAAGLLEHREERVLRIFPHDRWLARDAAHAEDVRRGVHASLVRGETVDERFSVLIALMWAVGYAHKVFPPEGVPARELKSRAKRLGEGRWPAKAVRDAIAADESSSAGAAT